MAVIFVMGAAIFILIIEVPGFLKRKQKKELAAFFVLFFIGTALSMAKALHFPIPNPLDAIAAIYKPFSKLLLSLLS
ncbi:hypothetical protein [Priestia abyssalis]|uniref:hypothetical protein n=1 Tax=Priestia abyssalis TaxID=1221450 RepID=UPI0009957B4D|nr:hypothetical protein [Priestia abyssalis]